MARYTPFANIEDARTALRAWLDDPQWRQLLCVDHKGEEVQIFFDRESVEKITRAGWVEWCGGFFSREECDRMLRDYLLEEQDMMAKFLMGRGPRRFIHKESEKPLGYLLHLEDGSLREREAYRVAVGMMRKKTENGQYHFGIDYFAPVE